MSAAYWLYSSANGPAILVRIVSALAIIRAIGWRRTGAISRPTSPRLLLGRTAPGGGGAGGAASGVSAVRHNSNPSGAPPGTSCGNRLARQPRSDPAILTFAPSSSRQCIGCSCAAPAISTKSVHGWPSPACIAAANSARSGALASTLRKACPALSCAVSSASVRSIAARWALIAAGSSGASGPPCQLITLIVQPPPAAGSTSSQAVIISRPSCARIARASLRP